MLAIYVIVSGVLLGVARWTERSGDSYPWRAEDYLRYTAPSLFVGTGENRIMLAGPSEAREDLLHEAFELAFPGMRAFQAGLSQGKFDEFLIGLEYWERVFGPTAVPRVLVLGITSRFVANLPRDESPLSLYITRYSPHFSVLRGSALAGLELIEKTALERLAARIRFLAKQPARFQSAACSVALKLVFDPFAGPPAGAEERPGAAVAAAFEADRTSRSPLAYARTLLRTCRSPYKYRLKRPMTEEGIAIWLDDPTSFWVEVHRWDPEPDSALIREQFHRLRATADRLGIDLYVVNLPEHPLHRERYRPGRYERYIRYVRDALGDTPFLDLRELLPASQFYDAGHATIQGAAVVTDTTIAFIRSRHPDWARTPARPIVHQGGKR